MRSQVFGGRVGELALASVAVLVSASCGRVNPPAVPAVEASKATTLPPRAANESLADMVARVEPSVALVRGRNGFGTGFVARPGLIVTNSHVIDGEIVSDLEILFPSADAKHRGPLTARLLFRDKGRDLAVLEVKTDLPAIPLAKSDNTRKGEDVTVIGNPGIGGRVVVENAVSQGVMSSSVVMDGRTFRQLNAAVNPGNSGGPVLDGSGRVIGVVSRKATEQEGLAFSVPVEDVLAALDRAEAGRPPTSGSAAITPTRPLWYDWKAGSSYVYAVRVSYEAGPNRVALEGTSVYRVTTIRDFQTKLSHRGNLVSRKTPREGQGATQFSVISSQPTEVTLDAKGRVANEVNSFPLPIVGDLALLVLEPLPENSAASWTISNSVTLREAQSRPGLPSPVPFGAPSIVPPRGLVPRIAPPGTLPPPPPLAAGLAGHPAQLKTTYTVEKSDANILGVHKTYELTSDEKVDGDLMFQVLGEGEWTMDAKLGVPRSLEYSAKLVYNNHNVTIRVPVTVSCRLLEGVERTRVLAALRLPSRPNLPISERDIDVAVGFLKGGDPQRMAEACARLADSLPVESRRAEVARTLEARLPQADPAQQNLIIRALGVWGDESSAKLVLARFKDAVTKTLPIPGELTETFASLGPNEDAARYLGSLLADEDQMNRWLDVCKLLESVGLTANLDALRKVAARKGEGPVGRTAAEALRQIRSRFVEREEFDRQLAALKGEFRDQVGGLGRLEYITPASDRRTEGVAAVAALIDSPNGLIPGMAVRVLDRWGGDAAREALIGRIRQGGGAWRECVDVLAKMGLDERAADALAARWEDDRFLVLRTLQTMGPRASRALEKGLQHPDFDGKLEVIRVLGEIGTPENIPALKAIVDRKTDGSFKQNIGGHAGVAIQAIRSRYGDGPGDSDARLTSLLAQLKEADNLHRGVFLKQIASTRPIEARRGEVSRVLEKQIRRDDPNDQVFVLRGLVAWGDAQGRERLAQAVEDVTYPKLEEAMAALATLPPSERSIRAMISRVKDNSHIVGETIRRMGPMVEPVLRSIARKNDDYRMQLEACLWLGRLGSPESVTVLQPLAKLGAIEPIAAAAEAAASAIEERQ